MRLPLVLWLTRTLSGGKPMAFTLDPKRCAVLAMDYQNEILGMTPDYREKNLLGTVKRVLDASRGTGATIIYITVSFRDDYADAPAHSPLFQDEKARGVMKAGSPGATICEELTPQAGDIVINSTVVICHAMVSMLPLDPAEYADYGQGGA
jgi:nicotinamidase-related amidase